MNGDAWDARLRILLPDNYSDTYERVAPVPMRSAGLKYRDGKVAWDEIWESFCDLAMAGGPPHRGRLLEPATQEEIKAAPIEYEAMVEEICRGIHLVTGLYAEPSAVPGWVQMYCPSAVMADWLTRAITMENVSAHRKGLVLSLPAGPAFRIEKEIKNVVTSVAKTTHYWLEHTSEEKKGAIAKLVGELNREGELLQPRLRQHGDREHLRMAVLSGVSKATGLAPASQGYRAWVGFECGSVPFSIALMRLLMVSNVLARREETTIFVPFLVGDAIPEEELVSRLAQHFQVLSTALIHLRPSQR